MRTVEHHWHLETPNVKAPFTVFFLCRHVADIRADDMDKEGQGVIGLQAGSNKGASQKGTACFCACAYSDDAQ